MIKIFTGNLAEIYYDNDIILDIIEKKLEKDIKVQIITRNGVESKPFINLKEKYEDKLKIFKLQEPTDIENHFLLIDGTSFRVEFPHKKEDTIQSKFNVYAKANFYNKNIAGYIGDIFKNLKINSVPI